MEIRQAILRQACAPFNIKLRPTFRRRDERSHDEILSILVRTAIKSSREHHVFADFKSEGGRMRGVFDCEYTERSFWRR